MKQKWRHLIFWMAASNPFSSFSFSKKLGIQYPKEEKGFSLSPNGDDKNP